MKGSESECYSDGEVWLSGGSNPFEGTVTVCHEGQWRNICILTSVLNWNTKHGQVVCRSLNYSTTGNWLVTHLMKHSCITSRSLHDRTHTNRSQTYCIHCIGVEITEFSRNVSVTETHVTYTCNGTEHNLTECISEESNFVCSKVGQLRCQGEQHITFLVTQTDTKYSKKRTQMLCFHQRTLQDLFLFVSCSTR